MTTVFPTGNTHLDSLLRDALEAPAKDQLEYRWRECESVYHTSHLYGHSGPAAYLQVGPCEHTTGLRCAPSVELGRIKKTGLCEMCGNKTPVTDYTFIPLGDI